MRNFRSGNGGFLVPAEKEISKFHVSPYRVYLTGKGKTDTRDFLSVLPSRVGHEAIIDRPRRAVPETRPTDVRFSRFRRSPTLRQSLQKLLRNRAKPFFHILFIKTDSRSDIIFKKKKKKKNRIWCSPIFAGKMPGRSLDNRTEAIDDLGPGIPLPEIHFQTVRVKKEKLSVNLNLIILFYFLSNTNDILLIFFIK